MFVETNLAQPGLHHGQRLLPLRRHRLARTRAPGTRLLKPRSELVGALHHVHAVRVVQANHRVSRARVFHIGVRLAQKLLNSCVRPLAVTLEFSLVIVLHLCVHTCSVTGSVADGRRWRATRPPMPRGLRWLSAVSQNDVPPPRCAKGAPAFRRGEELARYFPVPE